MHSHIKKTDVMKASIDWFLKNRNRHPHEMETPTIEQYDLFIRFFTKITIQTELLMRGIATELCI